MTSKISTFNRTVTSGDKSVPNINTLKINDRVIINNDPTRSGTVVYIGTTNFSNGEWIGIVLDEPNGKNNGTVQGKSYFKCEENYGVFARKANLTIMDSLKTHESTNSLNSSVATSSKRISELRSPTSSVKDVPVSTPGKSPANKNNFSDSKMNSTLQALVKEKESHIEQLIDERENERCELANLNLKNEELEKELLESRQSMSMLRDLVDNHEATIYTLNIEREKLIAKIEEGKKNLEDIQFQMLEDNIERSTGQDNDVRIFEMEEKLTLATNAQEMAEEKYQLIKNELEALKSKTEDSPNSPEELANLKLELSNMKCLNEKLTKDLADGKKNSQDDDKTSKKLEEEITLLKAEMEKLSKERDELAQKREDSQELELTAAKTEIEKLQKEIKDLTKNSEELLALREKVIKLTKEDESEKNEIASLRLENEKLIKERDDGELNRLKEENLKLTQEVQNLSKSLSDSSSADEHVKKLQAEILQLKSERDAGLEKLSRTTCQDNRDSESLEQLKAKNDEAEKKIKQLEQEKEKISEEANMKVNQAKGQLSEIEAELEFTSTQLAEEKRSAEEISLRTNTEFQQMVHDLQERENDLMEALSQIKSLEKDLAHANSQKNESEKENVNMESLEKEISTLKQELVTLKTESSEKITKLELELAELQETKESTFKNLSEEQMKLKTELELAQTNLSTLHKEKDSTIALITANLGISSMPSDLPTIVQNVMHLNSSKEEKILQMSQELDDLRKNLQQGVEEEKKAEDATKTDMDQFKSKILILEETISNLNKEKVAYETAHQTQVEELKSRLSLMQKIDPGEAVTVDMLNKIITDLHKENATLKMNMPKDLVASEKNSDALHKDMNGGQPKLASVKLSSRLFCDICEVFDEHDTDNCPQMNATSEDPSFQGVNIRKASKVLPSTRMYCDNCEIFDLHDTKDCPLEQQ